MALRKIFRQLFWANNFMFISLISNHTVFLIQFGINMHLQVFRKAETALANCGSCNFSKLTCASKFQIWTWNSIILCTWSAKFTSSVEFFDSSGVITKIENVFSCTIWLQHQGLLLAYWQSSFLAQGWSWNKGQRCNQDDCCVNEDSFSFALFRNQWNKSP